MSVVFAVFSQKYQYYEMKYLSYLSLSEVKVDSDLVAAQACQVVVVGELGFQLPELLFGKGCSFLSSLAVRVCLEA